MAITLWFLALSHSSFEDANSMKAGIIERNMVKNIFKTMWKLLLSNLHWKQFFITQQVQRLSKQDELSFRSM